MNLYLKQKIFSIGDKYKFTDSEQKLVYQAKKPAMSLTKIYMDDAEGKEILLIKRKLLAFLPQYTVLKDGKEILYVKKKFSIKPKFDITDNEGSSYSIQGNFIAYDFSLLKNDKLVGSIKKKIFSFGDAYELFIDDSFNPELFCSIALIIDNCIHNEKTNYGNN